MKNITVDELLDVISKEIYISFHERPKLKYALSELLESKKESTYQHRSFKDEWGNSDWRDTGEMGY